jgi:hypothetical protein
MNGFEPPPVFSQQKSKITNKHAVAF